MRRASLTATVAIGALLGVAARGALAQEALPNSTDLHAAYCIEILKYDVGMETSAVSSLQPPKDAAAEPPTVKEAREKGLATATALLEEISASLKRLQLYLLPRLMHLDLTGVVGADSAAKNDLARLSSMVNSCSDKCIVAGNTDAKCMNVCPTEEMPDLPDLQKKWKSCRQPDWLPF